MLVLSAADVESLLDLDELRVAIGTALVELSAGRVSMPERRAVEVDERSTLLVMPAHLPAVGALTTKLVSLFPDNVDRPTHQAMICCFDPATGTPLAVLDGEVITAARTAAAAALATQLLASTSELVAIVGSGVQAHAHVRALARLHTVRRFRIASRQQSRAANLAAVLSEELTGGGCTIEVADSVQAAVADADVVCLTTHAADPVIRREWLRDGVHVNSVGFNSASQGEVDQQTVGSCLVAVESRIAALAAAPAGAVELRIGVRDGRLDPVDVVELGELLSGTVAGRADDRQLTLYKSVGVAVEDAAAAALVLGAARAAGRGVEVPF